MDFWEMCVCFKNKLDQLSISGDNNGVNEIAVRTVSKILRNFSKYRLQDENLHSFLDGVVEYFALLIQYYNYNEDKPHLANFNVRMALNIFLFVVDRTNIYDKVFRKVVKIIIKLTEVYHSTTCIKEFLRMYIGVIKKISHSVTLQLTNKNHITLLTLLYSIVKNTNDVELQAVIVDIFLRYIRLSDNQSFHAVFPEIRNASPTYPVSSSKGYQRIRMILDKLNEDSSKLFSITCPKIMLDHVAVAEFIGASDNDDVWLDIDMEQCRLTFFCDPAFLSSFTNINFCNITKWEAISFFTKDVLKANFEYSSLSGSLEIGIKIKTSNFNLFSNVKFDTIRYLLIKISENNNKYNEFVELLPKLFPNFFSIAQLNAVKKVVEDSIVVSDDDSSPIIEHFESSTRNKKKIPTKRNRVSDNMEVSLVLSDSSSVISISDSDENEENTRIPVHEKIQGQNVSKVSTKKEGSSINKSITPISFTESVLGKNKHKISTIKKKNSVLFNSDENPSYKKISTLKERERPKLKISTNSISTTVNKQFVSKPESMNNIKSPIVYMSERGSSLLRSALVQEVGSNCSVAKVKTWLKNIEDGNKEIELQQKNIENDAAGGLSDEVKDLHVIGGSIEENLMKMFHSQGSNKSENRKNEESNAGSVSKEENVLDILLTPVGNENEKRPSVENSEETGESSKNSEEVPLAQLASDLKKCEENNLEAVRSEATVKTLEERLSSEESFVLQIAENSDEEETVLEQTEETVLEQTTKENFSKIQEEMNSNEELMIAPQVLEKISGLEDQLNETVTSQIQDTVKKNEETSCQENITFLNETVTSQISQLGKPSNLLNKVMKNDEISLDALKTTVKLQSSQTRKSSQNRNKVMKNEEISRDALKTTVKPQSSQTRKSSQNRNKVIRNEEFFDNPLNRTVKSQSSQTDNSLQIENEMRKNDETSKRELRTTVATQSSKIENPSQTRDEMKKIKEISSVNKPLNETISSQISQTGMSENRTQDISRLNITDDPVKRTKRKLYNPGDLSYLDTMITEEFLNVSKNIPKEPINNNTVRKTVTKKERKTKSQEKKPAVAKTPRKRGRKSKSELLKCDFSNNASRMSKPPVTELTFDKAFSNLKETVRKQKKDVKRKKKMEAVRRSKKNVTAIEVSSPSTPPSLEPFGECMKSSRNKRKMLNNIQTKNGKRVKKLEESDEDSGKEEANKGSEISSKIKVISNILIKPANICHRCLCTEDFGKSMMGNFLQFFKHVEQYHPELTATVECMEINDLLKRHYHKD